MLLTSIKHKKTLFKIDKNQVQIERHQVNRNFKSTQNDLWNNFFFVLFLIKLFEQIRKRSLLDLEFSKRLINWKSKFYKIYYWNLSYYFQAIQFIYSSLISGTDRLFFIVFIWINLTKHSLSNWWFFFTNFRTYLHISIIWVRKKKLFWDISTNH